MKKNLLILFILFFATSYSAEANSVRLGVANFVSRTSSVDTEELSHITEVFIKILSSSSSNIEVMESKTLEKMKAMTAAAATEAGKNAGCQYVLLGAVMNTGVKTKAEPWKDATVEYDTVLETRIIDVETGKIVLSVSGSGEAEYFYKTHITATAKGANEQMKKIENLNNDIKEKSLAMASSMASEKICASLMGEYPEIVSVSKVSTRKTGKKNTKSAKKNLGNIKINRGKMSGVNEETLYKIYFEGQEISDLTGEALGREKCTVGIAKVTEVRENSCVAEVFAGVFSNIYVGDKAEQITKKEALTLSENNNFVRTRIDEFLQ